MDQSQESKAEAVVLARVFEGIAGRLKAERGLTDHQIGVAMLQAGINTLSAAMDGPALVRLLAAATGGLMEFHEVDPSTGERTARGRPN